MLASLVITCSMRAPTALAIRGPSCTAEFCKCRSHFRICRQLPTFNLADRFVNRAQLLTSGLISPASQVFLDLCTKLGQFLLRLLRPVFGTPHQFS